MDATQRICDSILESDEEDHEDESENKRGRPLAKLCILKNAHIPETEVPLFLGENALGRDPNSCAVPLIAPSISKQHATICLSVYRKRGRHSEVDIQALVWDQGSMNGTRKGQMKLTPNVRYALSERDSLVVADIPCQYVSCAENAVSSQGDARTPVSRHSGVKATLLHATSTGGKKYVNGGTGARVSLPDQEDTMKTPGVTTVLSFEQTPTYPEESLVPESDSDSDGERGKRRRKAIGIPRCSTLLSPTNKTVPESEDESTITPSSSTKNRPRRHVSFSLEETDMDAGRQQLDNKKTVEIADDRAEEEHREEERTAPGGTQSEESEQHVPPVKTGSNVRLTGQDPEFTPSVFTDPIPVFDMDNTAQFHMDSDTDVDEDDEALDQVPKSVPSSAAHDKPHVIAVIQPEGVTMDSDTDVENVHLDSDTDVDEEEDMERGTHNKYPEIDETPTRLDIRPASIPAAPDSLQLDSDTDGEAIPAPALGEPASLTESCTAAQPGEDLDILSDSDADEEEDSALFIALVVLDVSVDPGTSDEADPDVCESAVPPAGDAADLKEDSDTDVEDAAESQIPSLQREMAAGLAPLQQNCSTPVPLTERGLEDMDTQAFFTPSAVPYRRAVAPAVRRMVLSASSGSQEDEDLVMAETQSFVLQTRGRRGTPPQDPGQAFSLESSGDEQSSREASFQFALSDSRHLQGQALAMENTQTFVGGDVSVSMEDTQAYAAVSNADGTSLESDPNLEATQAYGKEAEPAGYSVTSAKESQVDFDLKDTQEFISMPDSDSEDDTDDDDDDESRNTATAATQAFDVPTSSTLAMAETQLMPVFEEDESSDEDNLFSSVLQVKREEDGEADQPQKKHHSEALSVAETQPMHISEDEESDDEGLIPGPRKRKAKPPQLDEEQTQTLSNSELSLETQPMHMGVSETQPMATSEDEESDDEESERKVMMKTRCQPAGEDEEIDDEEDSILRPRKRKAKPLQIQEEGTQPLTSSEEREDQSEREIKEKEEQERLESEKTEREEMERMEREANERERIERERKEKEEKENLEVAKRELGERLERIEQAKLEREAKEKEEGDGLEEEEEKREEEKREEEKREEEKREEEKKSKTPARSRRATRATTAAPRLREVRFKCEQPGGPGERPGERPGGQEGQQCTPPSSQHQRYRQEEEEHGSEQIVDPTPAARGRKSRRGEQLPQEVDTEKADPQQADPQQADPQQAPTTRGRRRANVSEPNAAEKQDNWSQGCASGESPLPKRTVRGRAVKSETVEAPAAPAGSEGDREVGKGRKRDLEEATTEEASSSGSHKVFPGKRKAPEEAGGTNDETPVPAKRRGRASTAQANKVAGVSSAKVEGSEESETREEVPVKKRGRGRPSVAQRKMKEEQEESGLSVDHAEASEPQTPTSAASRKRQALADSSPVAKTPRSSSASPGGRLRSVSHAYKVYMVSYLRARHITRSLNSDTRGEGAGSPGGRLAKGVADMNCLVTDKVRRTVKFLCAVAKGVPIVTTHWLEKSCKAGSFLSPNAFAVQDPEQENRFSFCLQESLRIASSQPLLQGYHIHVTESVQPEPVQMKDIIFCSGATLLPKMPSPEAADFRDFLRGGPVSVRPGALCIASSLHRRPAGGRGRGRKKT
ncbi:hypothetical protein KUCAC02_014576 [Chaenocephalus aceratus]|uniref:Uncharacterized protein n=1 Tax=Chaenocephalus aceratus TaxID=36190 RepID=A0ACB9WEV8_CHAAC|nr:hypothetical protein KUCAC02_014576 [Chaenocephalus aceratus]